MPAPSASRQIDAIIKKAGGWKGERLTALRAVILAADAGAVEEVKWKKPSRPEGVAVWAHDGILCIGELLKGAVRLTFPAGASLADPTGLFNARLDSASVRAYDSREDEPVDARALTALVMAAARHNAAKAAHRAVRPTTA